VSANISFTPQKSGAEMKKTLIRMKKVVDKGFGV
jgi:hypothetical protein